MTPHIAIVGLGSIGKRHLTNLMAIGRRDIIGVDSSDACYEQRVLVLRHLQNTSAWDVRHAIICSPPAYHFEHASYFLKRGIPVFIEKPMAMDSDQANRLISLAALQNTHIAVGYMERANKTVLDAWAFKSENPIKNAYIECSWTMIRKSYSQDFLMESSHALDTARLLMGDVEVVDVAFGDRSAEFRLAHAGGYTFVTINANSLPMRSINLYAHNGKSFGRQYGYEIMEWDACYQAELKAFLDGKPLCTGENGLKVLELIERARA